MYLCACKQTHFRMEKKFSFSAEYHPTINLRLSPQQNYVFKISGYFSTAHAKKTDPNSNNRTINKMVRLAIRLCWMCYSTF